MYLFIYALLGSSSIFRIKQFGNKKGWLCFLFVILLNIYGLRGKTVGWDNPSYLKVFNYGLNNVIEWFEPGYMAIDKAVFIFFHNYIFLQFVIGGILLWGIFSFFYFTSYDIKLTIFIWFLFGVYFNYMNQVRQSLSTVVGMIAILLWKRNRIAGFAVALFSVLFHYGGVVFILFLFLMLFVDTVTKVRKFGRLIIIISVALVFFNGTLQLVLSRLPIASMYINRFTSLGYIDRGSYRFAIFYTGIVVLCTYLFHRCSYAVKTENILYFSGMLMALFFGYMSITLNMIQRSINSFVPLVVVCISNLLSESKLSSSKKKILIIVVLMVLSVYWVYYLAISNNGDGVDGVTPYTLFWQ